MWPGCAADAVVSYKTSVAVFSAGGQHTAFSRGGLAVEK